MMIRIFQNYIPKARQNRELLFLQVNKSATVQIKELFPPIGTTQNMLILQLLAVEHPTHLCHLLSSPYHELSAFLNKPAYKNYKIPKKRGGYRKIYAPAPSLKQVQRRLNYFLQLYYSAIKPKCAHGFVISTNNKSACNIAQNARPHIGKKHILNIDLKDFFPSIKAWQIKELFMSELFQFSEATAISLTLLVTHEGMLPQGVPTSPALSNFICFKLDSDLEQLAKKHYLTYTRYADDLTFSANRYISNDVIQTIRETISKHQFTINERKVHVASQQRRQTVTGLTVNNKLSIDRRLRKRLRAMVHDLDTNGLEIATRNHYHLTRRAKQSDKEAFLNKLSGWIGFYQQINGIIDDKCRAYYNIVQRHNNLFLGKEIQENPIRYVKSTIKSDLPKRYIQQQLWDFDDLDK